MANSGHNTSAQPKGGPTTSELATLRERLAEIEHLQWCDWSKAVAESERVSPERLAAWSRRWVPYAELAEADKDLDRVYADMVLVALHESTNKEARR